MPTEPVITKSNDEIFLELAKTVGQTIPAQRLFDYKQAHQLNGNPRYWAIVDFNQHSKEKRLYLFDTRDKEVVRYYVAHGKGSEGASDDGMADEFSNADGSHASSLGIYRCGETYKGDHGLSLRLDGLEDTNSKARIRDIVLHKAEYVSDKFIKDTGRIGRSWGCFAVENSALDTLVSELKNGSYLIAWKKQN